MPVASVWDRIADAGPAAVVLCGTTLALLVLPLLRRLAPRRRQTRGGPARLLLGLAGLLALGAIGLGTMGAASPGNLLQLAAFLALILGLLGMAGLVVFDVILPRLRIDVPSILRDLVLVTIGLAIGMGFLRLAGLDVFSLVTTSAVLTAVVGLALQSTIANVFSGLGLQLDRTLRHGEWIEVGGRVGRILEIGWRSTRIQTKDGDTVFVPNSELVSKELLNFARPGGAHRMTMRVGFDYRHPPHEVRRTLLRALEHVPGLLGEPPPDCGPIQFGDYAVVYALRYWIGDVAHDTSIEEEVHTRVWYAARRAGLEMPFPVRTVISSTDAAQEHAAAREREQEAAASRLAATSPFTRLDRERVRRCADDARRLEFGRGEHVLRPQDQDDSLYLIDSGEVAVRLPPSDVSRALTLGSGDLLGRLVLPHYEACVALSEVALFRIDHRALDEMLATDGDLATGLSAIAATRHDAAGVSGTTAREAAGAMSGASLVPRLHRLLGKR